MQQSSNRAQEHAQAMVDLERQHAIDALRGRLKANGRPDCADCGEIIAAKRRAALPSATRCASCQSRRERIARRGW